MAISFSDQQELFLPLVEGIYEKPPWGQFMRNLVARTRARRAVLVVTLANAAPGQEPTAIHVAAPRAVAEPPIDFRRIAKLGLHPHGTLRAGRVYAIDEMLDFGDKARLAHQREVLDSMGIRYGRWLRASAGGVADAWILLVREREDLSSSAAATLGAICPHVAAALRTFVALNEQRLQSAIAQCALGKLGIGHIAFDETARVMAADGLAEQHLSFAAIPDGRPGRRLLLPMAAQAELECACSALASEGSGPGKLHMVDTSRGSTLLLQSCNLALPEGCARPAAIGTIRLESREDERVGAQVLRHLHDLSEREAALAEKMSRGDTIVEAGRKLHLSDETARNYSKRIYAKTGARGQADLVRKVLCGLVPLA